MGGTVTEAGRVLSSANEKLLRDHIASMQKMLDDMAGGSKPDATAMKEAADVFAILEAEMSSDEKSQAIRAAILSGIPAYPPCYVYIRALYDNYVIYAQTMENDDCDLIRRDYTIADGGTVTLGAPVEVQAQMTYVPVPAASTEEAANTDKPVSVTPPNTEESAPTPYTDADLIALREAGAVDLDGDVVPLAEKAIRADGTMPVKLIRPGWGSSGYYSAAMLKRDGPQVFKAGTHMYVNHPTPQEESQRPERDIRDLAAVLSTDATYQERGVDGPGLYADAHVFSHWRPFVEEVAPHTGVSIRAMGKDGGVGEAEGRKGKIIESLVAARSADLVTVPGAGGKALQLFESARSRAQFPPKGDSSMNEEELRKLQEASEAQAQQIKALEEQRAADQQIIARMREVALLREAKDFVTQHVMSTTLPDVTKIRLIEGLANNPPTTAEGQLDRDGYKTRIDETVKNEAEYLHRLSGSGVIVGMGGSSAPMSVGAAGEPTMEEADKALSAALGGFGLSESAARFAVGGR